MKGDDEEDRDGPQCLNIRSHFVDANEIRGASRG